LKGASLAEDTATTRKAAFILAIIALAEGGWLLLNANHRLGRFLHYTGFEDANAGTWGWVSAAVITLLFLAYSARLPSVRSNFIRFSWLKILAIAVAITAAFCEETIFRKVLMDALQDRGFGLVVQLAASAVAFGVAHAVWGLFRGSFMAALRIVLVTGALGFGLALVYLISHRIVATCIVAHFAMNFFAEPGLVLSALKEEMSQMHNKI
jgi:uncharacterized protein